MIIGNDLIYLYDLKYINASNCKLTSRYVNSTTAIDTGKRWKQFYEIPVRYAQVFEKDVDRWKQINK